MHLAHIACSDDNLVPFHLWRRKAELKPEKSSIYKLSLSFLLFETCIRTAKTTMFWQKKVTLGLCTKFVLESKVQNITF